MALKWLILNYLLGMFFWRTSWKVWQNGSEAVDCFFSEGIYTCITTGKFLNERKKMARLYSACELGVKDLVKWEYDYIWI